MPIQFACPVCKKLYTVDDFEIGKKTECVQCGQRIQVPTPSRNRTVLGEAVDPLPSNIYRCIFCSAKISSPKAVPVGVTITCPKCRQRFNPNGGDSNGLDQAPIPLPKRIASQTLTRETRSAQPDEDSPKPSLEYYGYLPPIPKSRTRLAYKAVGCGIVLFSILIAVAVIVFLRGCDSIESINPFGASTQDEELLIWVPPDTEVLVSINVEELKTAEQWKSLLQGKQKGKQEGLVLPDPTKVILASKGNRRGSQEIEVYRLSKPFDPNPYIRSGAAKVKKKDGRSYLEFADENQYLFNPTGGIVILSPNENMLFEAMEGKTGKVRVDPEVLKLFREAKGPINGVGVGPAAQTSSPVVRFSSVYKEPPPLCLSQLTKSKMRSDRIDFEVTYQYSAPEKRSWRGSNWNPE